VLFSFAPFPLIFSLARRRPGASAEHLEQENKRMEERLRELKQSIQQQREERAARGGIMWRSAAGGGATAQRSTFATKEQQQQQQQHQQQHQKDT
jgi:hypothetical protein